jgi:hypothetical protein
MRIRITVEDVTPAQRRWLLDNVDTIWPIGTDDQPVCVEFVGPDRGSVIHRETGVRRWLKLVEQLRDLTTRTDVPELPPIFPPYDGGVTP